MRRSDQIVAEIWVTLVALSGIAMLPQQSEPESPVEIIKISSPVEVTPAEVQPMETQSAAEESVGPMAGPAQQNEPEPRQRHDPVLGENSAMTLTPYSDYAFAKSQAELGKKDFLAVIIGEGQNDWLKGELAASEALLQGWVVYAGPVGDWLGPDGKSFSTPRVLVNPKEAATQNPTYIGHGAGSLVKFLKATKGR